MPTYEYRCLKCLDIYDIRHEMSEPKIEEYDCPFCGSKQPCEKLISGGGMIQFGKHNDDLDFQSTKKNRGYRGKYRDLLRPVGTPVDAPALKSEADRQFQNWVDTGGLDGIKEIPDLKKDKNDPRRPKKAEEYAGRKAI